jgi:AIPR protein
MNTITLPRSKDLLTVPYNNIRNISSPEDLENNRRVYSGQISIKSIVELPTNENVRDYLLDADGKQKKRPTSVHRAIRETLDQNPHEFSVLNGGLVIVARDVDIDDKAKTIQLLKPSIINGSQTQGVIRDFLAEYPELDVEVHVKFELIITTDDGLIADISIARNFQNDVMQLSIAGRLGQLDELENSLQIKKPEIKLSKNETQWSTGPESEYFPTEKLLQVITALTPSEIWHRVEDRDNPNKVYAYSRKAQCLKEFQEIFRQVKDLNHPNHHSSKKLYQFYLDISSEAVDLYLKWKSHSGFKGSGLHALKRDEAKNIVEVPDGILFPILSALSVFMKETPEGWRYSPPQQFSDAQIIQSAKSTYIDIAKSNPQTMGKSKPCYSALFQITSIYKMLTN